MILLRDNTLPPTWVARRGLGVAQMKHHAQRSTSRACASILVAAAVDNWVCATRRGVALCGPMIPLRKTALLL